MRDTLRPFAGYKSRHFDWSTDGDGRVATLTLNRPDKKNPLTFESYAELRDLFRDIVYASDVRAIVLTGAGGNFCSGGDVFEIIEPLTRMSMPDLLAFTRMTGDVIKAMRKTPQPIICAIDGICAGAGAMLALASDLRYATPQARTAFLFTRVGLAGADMGACGLLPRVIGQGRAAELLFTGRAMTAEEGQAWGFFNGLHASERGAGEGAGHGSLPRRRTLVRTRRHQDHDEPGMGDGHRGDGRVRGAGAGDLHGHQGLPPRLRRVRREVEAGLRGGLTCRSPRPRGPASPISIGRSSAPSIVFSPSGWIAGSRTAGSMASIIRDTDAACKTLVTTLGEAGFLDPCVPAAFGGARDELDSRLLCIARERSPMPTASPISPSPCRDSAPVRSRFPARRRCSSVCCRLWPRER